MIRKYSHRHVRFVLFTLYVLIPGRLLMADTTVLPDLQLANWTKQWGDDNLLNYKTDLAGDPGYLYNLTIDRTAEGGNWDDLAIGRQADIPLAGGDNWQITVYNPYSNGYPIWIGSYYHDSTWTCHSGDQAGWVYPGQMITMTTPIDPAHVPLHSAGLQIGSDGWTGAPLIHTFDLLVFSPGTGIPYNLTRNSDIIGRFEKFEATFRLTRPYSNPFDPNIIDITATFHQPDNSTVTIPAFFFTDYEIIGSNPETYANPGPEQWKVRFAPSQPGPYTYDLTLTDADGINLVTNAGSFLCTESGRKGFIRVSSDDPAYLAYDDGTTRLNIGHLIGWKTGGIYGWNDFMTKMSSAGENWVRLWMCQYSGDGGVLLEEKKGHYTGYFSGVGKLSMQTALRLDHFVDIAAQKDIVIQLCLQHHGQFSTFADAAWHIHPYNILYAESDGGFLQTPDEFFTDEKARQLTKNKYRYIVARWGYSPAIFAWELFNEYEFTDGWQNNPDSVADWHQEMAQYIKQIDPFDHPVTTSMYANEVDEIWRFEEIDLIETHRYSSSPIDYFSSAAPELADYQKPVIMAEFGAGRFGDIPYPEEQPDAMPQPYRTQLYEGLMLHNGIWCAFHLKSSAHMWWYESYIDPLNLYGVFTPLAVYAQGEDMARYGLSPAPKAVGGFPSYCAAPVLIDYWSVSGQTDFTLTDGYFPGMKNLSSWLHGSWSPVPGSDPVFHLTMPAAGVLKIYVEYVSSSGANSLRVMVDSNEVFASTYDNQVHHFTIRVPLEAGPQAVQVQNTGQGYFFINGYEFVPANPLPLDSVGLCSPDRAYLWIYDKGSQYGRTANGTFHDVPIFVKGLNDGRYRVEVYNTRGAGGILQVGRAESVGGVLTYTLPDFSKDIAVKVKPNLTVDIEDLAAFCSFWLTGDPNLAGTETVDYADFQVFSGFWLDNCPNDWPF